MQCVADALQLGTLGQWALQHLQRAAQHLGLAVAGLPQKSVVEPRNTCLQQSQQFWLTAVFLGQTNQHTLHGYDVARAVLHGLTDRPNPQRLAQWIDSFSLHLKRLAGLATDRQRLAHGRLRGWRKQR